MKYVKWTFVALFWTLVFAFLHYTLPQHDVARITDTLESRVNPGENSWFWAQAETGNDPTAQRDVFFIQTRRADDSVMVYRNEDTGWGWPPYFKFDTANLQAEAADLKSTSEAPKWAAIKHYGWRNEFMSIFPNAVSVKPVAGPDAGTGIPWLNIIILTVFFAFVWAIWVRWRRFRAARIDPMVEDMTESWDVAGDAVADRRSRAKRWLDSWRAK